MELSSKPLQVLSVCAADGRLRPLRFRYEDEAQMLQTIRVDQILSTKKVQYVGAEALIFLCRASLDQREHLFELRYDVREHRWVLQRALY